MHYNGPIVRPPTNANDVFIELTVGCSYDGCKFCSFYEGYPFQQVSWSQIEADLQEAARFDPNAKRVWASGGNPYTLSVSELEKFAKLVKKYLPNATIATYARIDDFYNKSVEDIRYLGELGFTDILVGVESADDEVLYSMDKGYTASDVLTQLKKVEDAGISYRVIYLGGLAGKGHLVESAKITANVLNQLHPYMIFLTTVAVIPGTPLALERQNGTFIEADEYERIEEFYELIKSMKNDIFVFARSASNFVDFTANLPEQKEMILAQLEHVLENFTEKDEKELKAIRPRIRRV